MGDLINLHDTRTFGKTPRLKNEPPFGGSKMDRSGEGTHPIFGEAELEPATNAH
jgi:hypothetical protein